MWNGLIGVFPSGHVTQSLVLIGVQNPLSWTVLWLKEVKMEVRSAFLPVQRLILSNHLWVSSGARAASGSLGRSPMEVLPPAAENGVDCALGCFFVYITIIIVMRFVYLFSSS